MPCSGSGWRLRVVSNIGAALQILISGNISLFAQPCERARGDAFDPMLRDVAALGANAVIALRDATTLRKTGPRCRPMEPRSSASRCADIDGSDATLSRRTASLSNR